jgi:hypothetical protein
VQKKLKEAGAEIIGIEGEQVGEWVLVDAGGLVVHVMHPGRAPALQPGRTLGRGAQGARQPLSTR